MSLPVMSGFPRVDVVVSAFNEERYIGRCLDALLAQDYGRELSVIVVDGGSRDGTVAAARERESRDGRLRVFADGARRNLPAAMNVGLHLGTGDLVAKVDAHGYPEDDFVRRAVEAFSSAPDDVAVVGGRPIQAGETEWGEAAARARTSRFGTGGSVYAGRTSWAFVDTVQCGIYRRDVLTEVGGFDESMEYGEDDELNWRLRDHGWRVLLDGSIRFHYITRPSLAALARQYHRYGIAKVRVVASHPRRVRPWHLAPAFFVAASAALAAAAPWSRAARVRGATLAAAYGTAALVAAVRTPGPRSPSAVVRVAACFAAMHIAYGSGALRGLAGLVAHARSR